MSGTRRPAITLLLLLLATPGLAAALADGQGAAPMPQGIDEAWLATHHDALEERYGDRFIDVGVAMTPIAHIAVLFDGPAPDQLPRLHGTLATRGYDVSAALPVTHGPLVPVMMAGAQQIPRGIAPGAWLHQPYDCTLAHIVQDGTGRLYGLTAGHCVNGPGDRATILQPGAPAAPEELAIGTVLAARNQGIGQDFALIAIDAGVADQVDPAMHGWGGPTGVATVQEADLGTVQHYGFGTLTWQAEASRCRAGLSGTTFLGATAYGFVGLIAYGDSGSPAQTGTGQALGINTHLGATTAPGNALGTRITYALDQLGAMTGLELALVEGGVPHATCQIA